MANYAFAIVQGFNCWCSNDAPGVTSSSSNCNTKCPGYGEFCGGDGYYGYIALNQAPAGTVGPSDSAASSTPLVSTSFVPILYSSCYTHVPLHLNLPIARKPAPGLLYCSISDFDISSATGNCYCEWCPNHHLLYGYSKSLADPLDVV